MVNDKDRRKNQLLYTYLLIKNKNIKTYYFIDFTKEPKFLVHCTRCTAVVIMRPTISFNSRGSYLYVLFQTTTKTAFCFLAFPPSFFSFSFETYLGLWPSTSWACSCSRLRACSCTKDRVFSCSSSRPRTCSCFRAFSRAWSFSPS